MDEWPCVVCGGTVDESTSAICDGCGGRFHLNKRNDAPGKDCGDVRVNDLYMSLEFGCFTCRRGQTPAPTRRRERRVPARERPRRYRRRS